MRILVTGGSGVIGKGLIPELIRRGHAVRLLSRHASDDAKNWEGVEPFPGDISDPESLRTAADGCEAVVHIAGIAAEQPPELTFEKVNVGGTRNILAEASRSGAHRFIFMSSLGAERGSSDYHHSKLEAERLVEQTELDWTILRPGSVFGPGDEVISSLLKMVRALPAVPVIDDAQQRFQPIWYEDLAGATANTLERPETIGRTIELAGEDVTTVDDLLSRFAEITGRKPIQLPVPMAVASAVTRVAAKAMRLPIDETKLQMLRDENVLSDPGSRPLHSMGVEPTPLDRALRLLADAGLEQLPEDGVGAMRRKRFWADIHGSSLRPAALMSKFRDNVNDVMPIEFAAEPGAPSRAEQGTTMTGSLPLRGNFQVRVEKSDPTHIVFATLEGHPISGMVEFRSEEIAAGGVRFSVEINSRAANFLDLLALRTVGDPAQSANWRTVVQRMIDRSGGTSDGVHSESMKLDDEEAARIEERLRSLVQARSRDESSAPERPA